MSTYSIFSCASVRAQPDLVPDRAGVYVFTLADSEVLNEALARHDTVLEPLSLGVRRAVYFGSTDDSLRRRLKVHLTSDSVGSTFRRSLGLLLAPELSLHPVPVPTQRYFHFAGRGEEVLTQWMCEHLNVAVRVCTDSKVCERRLIQSQSPILNIQHRHMTPMARRLTALRRRQSGRDLPPPPRNGRR